MEGTLGRLLVDAALPKHLRGLHPVLDKKGSAALYQALAQSSTPEEYVKHTKALSDLAAEASYLSGAYSFGPEHLRPTAAVDAARTQFQGEIRDILADTRLSDKARNDQLVHAGLRHSKPLQEAAYGSASAAGNPLALQVSSGAKGKPDNVKSLMAGDTLYSDSEYKPIPFPVTSSFYQGLRPHEYYAGTHGARLAIILTKIGTASGGYLAKRMRNVAHRLVVSSHDAEQQRPDDPLTGFRTALDDHDNEGALLAAQTGNYPRNTILSRDVIADLKRNGVKDVVLRSPMVGGPADGGVYARDVGVREKGRLAPLGDQVGLAAADSISEPATQSIIGCIVRGTRVRMADWSTKPIEKIQDGDYVLGADMTGRTFPVRVTRVFDNGPLECVRTVFGYGRRNEDLVFESTPDHKVLGATVKSSCKEAALNGQLRQLPIGKVANRFYAQPGIGFDGTSQCREDRALLLGLLLGDGCYTEGVGCNPHLSCADPRLITDVEPYLAQFNLKLTKLDAGGGLTYRFSQIEQAAAARDPESGRIVGGFRNPAKLYLDSPEALGKYSYQKTIPDAAYSWDNESVAALLAGLFVTDGSVYQVAQGRLPFASFNSTSRRLVEQFRELVAWRFGIYFGPITSGMASRKRPLFGTELAKFVDVVRLRGVLPLVGIKRVTYDTLLRAAEVATAKTNVRNRGRLDAPFRYKRKSQTSIGVQPTHDIEVDHPDHLFVLANGLIVSNSKHSGGVAGATTTQQGFPVLDKMMSIPSEYNGAVHADNDGVISTVRKAPQGGQYVAVGGVEHYVPPGVELIAKRGDRIEAGDLLTDGPENPAKYVEHKGIGEARKRFVDMFMRASQAAGFKPHRRNLELIARGYHDHVELHKETDDNVPGDVVSYTALEHNYEPRPGFQRRKPAAAEGMYLERPALHHTIGTKVKPSVIRDLEGAGIDSVPVHKDPPPFTPVAVRSHATLENDPDFMTRMMGSNLEKGLLKGVHLGHTTDTQGTSFVGNVAEGTGLGLTGKTKGWDPVKIPG